VVLFWFSVESMSFDIASGDRFRLEHRVASGTGPEGDISLIIRRNGSVTVDCVDAEGTPHRFHAQLARGVYERLVELMHDAGFPESPAEIVAPGRTRVVSAIRAGRELHTRPIAHATTAPHWATLLELFDGIASQTSGGRLDGPSGEALVSGAAELPVFRPSQEMDEPPLGEDSSEVIGAAWRLAIDRKHGEVTPLHLLVALARDHGYQLQRLGLDADRIQTAGEALFPWDDAAPAAVEPVVSPAFEVVSQVARRIAAEDGAHEGTLRHLVRALLQAGGTDVTRVLQTHRLPDAMLGGRTRDRIFKVPEPSIEKQCPRCGTLAADQRWCARCGHVLITPAPFSTGSLLDQITLRVEPHAWAERARAAHRSLCNLPDQAGTPWLGFYVEEGGNRELVTPERLAALGVSLERLEKNAVANLARAPASWTPRWVQGADGREVDVLFCSDEPHAPERIFDKPFLLHAQAMLGSNALVAAVPTRSTLLLTRLEHLAIAMALARQYFETAEAEPISPWGFAIQDGALSGPISSG
jgi:hypothetical protein